MFLQREPHQLKRCDCHKCLFEINIRKNKAKLVDQEFLQQNVPIRLGRELTGNIPMSKNSRKTLDNKQAKLNMISVSDNKGQQNEALNPDKKLIKIRISEIIMWMEVG